MTAKWGIHRCAWHKFVVFILDVSHFRCLIKFSMYQFQAIFQFQSIRQTYHFHSENLAPQENKHKILKNLG